MTYHILIEVMNHKKIECLNTFAENFIPLTSLGKYPNFYHASLYYMMNDMNNF